MSENAAQRCPLAIRLEVLPGDSVLEKFSNAREFGFDAVELPGRYLNQYFDELMACRDRLSLKISSISLGFRGSLVATDEETRKVCRQDIERLLDLCADLGAVGLVMPPYLNIDAQNPPAGTSRAWPADELDALLFDQLPALAETAHRRGVLLLLEPVNRYETQYLTTIAHAARICKLINSPGLGITADFYHMQLEELSPANALREAGRWIRHVHVADNTRVEPGAGCLDFRPGFEALRDIGYQGYIVVECRSLSGSARDVLPRSSHVLRQLMHI